MTVVLASASLFVPVVSALLLLRATLRVSWSLVMSLAILVGFGLSSLEFALSLFLFDGSRLSVYGLDFVVLAVALAVYLRRGPLPIAATASEKDPVRLVLLPCLALAVITGATIFIVNTIVSPHGEWDAWAIWNLRARFLYHGGSHWRAAFDERLAWSHPDYPLLLPSLVARGWRQLGSPTPVVPALVAFLFAAASVGILYGSLSSLHGRMQALLGALSLTGTLVFTQAAATQLADLPVGCFVLATCALLVLHWRQAGRAYGLWAGFLCGMAAWTKNEGALLVLCVLAVEGVRVLRARALAWDRIGPFLLGLVPGLALLVLFKVRLAPASYLFEDGAGQMLARILTPGRYVEIAHAFFGTGVTFGGWLALALIAYAILIGKTRDDDNRRASFAIGGIVTLMLAGFFAVYVITPKDLAWQLEFSLSRLLLQLWPSALLAFFLFTAGPTEVTIRR